MAFLNIDPDRALVDNLETLAKYAAAIRAARWVVVALAEVFAEQPDTVAVYATQTIDGNISGTVYLPTFAGIVEIRRRLAEVGIRLREGSKVTEHPEHNAQSHPLTAEGGTRVDLTFYLQTAEGAKKRCEYVKVGTKTVEQPVYELRCTEAAA